MGWGEKAIEIRSVETGHLDGVFMHKRAQRLKFLCERNDKVGAPGPAPAVGLGAGGVAVGSSGGTACITVSFPPPNHHWGYPLPKQLCLWGWGGRAKTKFCSLQLSPSRCGSQLVPTTPRPPSVLTSPSPQGPPSFLTSPTPQVFFASVRSGGSSQVYFMTLNRNCIMNW